MLGARFSDAQCGFKAIRRDQARALLPLIEDTGWFFDTELLVLAERAGLRIHEVPVDWVDDPDSRVDIVATALADLRGMMRLGRGLARGTIKVPQLRVPSLASSARRRRGASGELLRAGGVVRRGRRRLHARLRAALPAAARRHVGPGRQRARLLVTAVANTAANRRLTFGISGRRHAARHQFKGLIVFGIGLALTSGRAGRPARVRLTRPWP